MRFILCFAIGLSLLLWGQAFAQREVITQLPYQLALPGSFHGEDVVAKNGERWLGVSVAEDGTSLALYDELLIEQVHDPIADAKDEKTGRQVSAAGRLVQPVFWVQGLDVSQGAITTILHAPVYLHEPITTGPASNKPRQSVSLNLSATQHYEITMKPRIQYGIKMFIIALSDEQTTQTLADNIPADGDATPAVLWAGDLDRDGKLDVLMDLTPHYNVSFPTLFLSSLASPDELVGKAAALWITGC